MAYRPLKGGGEWSTLAVDEQTSSLHLRKLLEGMVYRVRVLAFNSIGNGIPGEAKEIKMEEGGVLTDSLMETDQNKTRSSESTIYVVMYGNGLVNQKKLSSCDPIKVIRPSL